MTLQKVAEDLSKQTGKKWRVDTKWGTGKIRLVHPGKTPIYLANLVEFGYWILSLDSCPSIVFSGPTPLETYNRFLQWAEGMADFLNDFFGKPSDTLYIRAGKGKVHISAEPASAANMRRALCGRDLHNADYVADKDVTEDNLCMYCRRAERA